MKEKEVDTPWHSKKIQEIYLILNTSEKGVTQRQAQERITKYGKNILKETHKLRPLKIFIEQFNSFFIYILFVSSIIMFFLDHFIDSVVIFAILLLNGGIGFFQQYKAEKAIISLRKLIIPKTHVIRDGKMFHIPSTELVVGDIVILNEGDKVNADARIIECENLQTDEAVLTGESLPVDKSSRILKEKIILTKKENMLFTGTQIVRGSAKAVVVSTGMNTVFGKIAETLQEIEIQKTPIQKRLDKFSKQLGMIIIGIVLIVMLLGIFEHFNAIEMFLTAVALAIGAIPEGLPAVLVIAFAISSLMLSKQNVIIRRLPAVESLGSVTVICTDKTGTLTEEEMRIQQIFSNNTFYEKKENKLYIKNKTINLKQNKELLYLIKTSILCNNSRFELEGNNYKLMGDPTEKALLSNSLDLGFNKKELTEKEPSVKKFEFHSKRRMMSVARKNGRNITLYSKGAPEKIIDICKSELINGQIKKLTLQRKKQLLEQSKKMEQDALRVLGFAYKNFASEKEIKEQGLIFLGFVGMIDPPRKEVKLAIKECVNAGIKVKMITGDSVLTAKAIARQIGIKGKVISEEELIKMNDSELFNSIDDIAIFARTTPNEKLRITKILQQKQETVAITGDGINDVLALKAADIGIAMGKRGSDVARDVCDIILIDDNFASLVQGVKQGRKTYDNIKKFTKYLLAVNFSEILLIFITLLLRMPLPLLPLQILWINLITDSFPALTLVFEKEENVMKTKPRNDKNILHGIWRFIIFAGILAFLTEFLIYLIGTKEALPIEEIRTMVLTTGILFELFFVYSCRSDRSLKEIGFFSNKWLNIAIVSSFALHLFLLYSPLRKIFGVVPLTLNDWLFVLPFSISGLLIFEITKMIKNKK